MNEYSASLYPYILLALTSLLVNIPLGYIRENTPKFSLPWLFWIHASIPLVIYLRMTLGTSRLFIPVCIFWAIVGQIWGSRARRRVMSQEDAERLQQIPKMDIRKREGINDEEALIVLLNMGGPKTNADVPDFQKRLFSDPLLIRFPMSFVFQKLFALLLVAFRTKEAQKRYQRIGGGSPIFESTLAQTRALQAELSRRGRTLSVTFAFNYSPPFSDDVIQEAKKAGKKYLLPLSLYPHYSKATTGSNVHYLRKSAEKNYPTLMFLESSSYYLHDGYIEAFVDRIQEQVRPYESLDDVYLVFSAHGLPLYFLTEGDPYPFQISQTVTKVLAKLNRNDRWIIAYQSAVGPLQWIKPSTGDVIAALARRNIKKILIVPISFVTDHIETTCEIDMEYRAMAEQAGIKDFRMSKAIECHPGFICALADAVERELPAGRNAPDRLELSGSNLPMQKN
ncbi:MAG: ferrochelatase [Omnitrophica WOR_2 bacterium RIFCSPHIGHO2_02_FULL_52_10]|nr:MAG: ferrochelatase [Omnitrophica WOR_2 bacterium RIFCSPHIGHO2_02_FULL_52_10]